MKKVLFLLLFILLIPFTASALEINSLGLKAKDIDGINIYTRAELTDSYTYYVNNIYAQGENDNYKVYIRSIKNPIEYDYIPSADLTDDVFGLISNVNTNEYSYLTTDSYKWIRFIYKTKESNIQLLEYYLSYKDIFITVTFECKNTEFSFDEKNKMDEFVKSIQLTGEGQAEVSHIYLEGIDTKPFTIKYFLLIEIVVCVVAILITYLVTRKKR